MIGKISWLYYHLHLGLENDTYQKNSTEISIIQNFSFPQPDPLDPTKVNGVDYHFVSKDNFEKLIKNNKFYEHAKIFENYYGTLKEDVDQTILKNDIIFDIDWQGTKQLSSFQSKIDKNFFNS